MYKNFKLIAAALCSAGAVSFADAASLTPVFEPGKPLEIMNTDNDPDNVAQISVVDGKAGYQGIGGDPNNNQPNPSPGTDAPVSGFFGDGTVVDYRFFGNVVDENVSLEAATYSVGAAGRIGAFIATSADNVSGGNINYLDVYDTTDPGAGFGGGSQIVPSAADHTTNTMGRIADGTGTIDITNMLDGQLYFLAGGFGGTERFTLTMTGAGQTDIVEIGDAGWPRDNRVHLHDWTFDNADLLYDTITYQFFHADRDGSAARVGGVVLDGNIASTIPSPTAALAGLIGLGGLVSRRRRKDA